MRRSRANGDRLFGRIQTARRLISGVARTSWRRARAGFERGRFYARRVMTTTTGVLAFAGAVSIKTSLAPFVRFLSVEFASPATAGDDGDCRSPALRSTTERRFLRMSATPACPGRRRLVIRLKAVRNKRALFVCYRWSCVLSASTENFDYCRR